MGTEHDCPLTPLGSRKPPVHRWGLFHIYSVSVCLGEETLWEAKHGGDKT